MGVNGKVEPIWVASGDIIDVETLNTNVPNRLEARAGLMEFEVHPVISSAEARERALVS